MDPAAFRRHGHAMIDWLSDYFENIEDYPVRPAVQPGDILKTLPQAPPEQPEPMEDVFRDFREQILPGITHWQHPGWFAYFPANNSPASVLAELLTAGLGVQGMLWQTSPAAAELEERVMQWLALALGLPSHFEGVIQDTASTATLCALISARERVTGFEGNRVGLHKPLVVYVSSETHSSIEKGMKIAGYGKENLHRVATDEDLAMDPRALDRAIRDDLGAGRIPACVVATLGTTSSLAMDPVPAIAAICQKHGVWLHVDAAFAGTAAIHPAFRWITKGVEQADSFVFNPHKWMLTNFDCSAYFVKDAASLVRSLEILPEYLKTPADSQVRNYRDWGIQLGRRFRALKLWFVLRTYGLEGIREMVGRHVRLAREFAGWVEDDPRFELLAPLTLSLVCFRYNPGGLPEEELDRLNRRLLEEINSSGQVFLTHTVLKGRYTIRLMVGQRNTGSPHTKRAWDIIRKAAGSFE